MVSMCLDIDLIGQRRPDVNWKSDNLLTNQSSSQFDESLPQSLSSDAN